MKEYNEPTIEITTFAHQNIITASAITQALQDELDGYKSGSATNIQSVAYIIDWNE